jgi:hypothetical protein
MRWRRSRKDGTRVARLGQPVPKFGRVRRGGLRHLGECGADQLVGRVLQLRSTGHVTKQIGPQTRLLDVRATLVATNLDKSYLDDYLVVVVRRESSVPTPRTSMRINE